MGNSLAYTVSLDTDINSSRRRLTSSPRKITTKQKQSISIKNLVGGEKNTTEVLRHNNESNNVRYLNQRSTSAVEGAEAKIQDIIQAKKVKQGRRSDIRKSLDSVLLDENKNRKDEGVNKNREKEVIVADSELLISDEKETTKREIRRCHS